MSRTILNERVEETKRIKKKRWLSLQALEKIQLQLIMHIYTAFSNAIYFLLKDSYKICNEK